MLNFMKKLSLSYLFRNTLALLILLTVSLSVQAQSLSGAQINDNRTIVLDVDAPLSLTYEVDVNHFASNMPDQAIADSFVDQFERNYVECSVDRATLILTVTLETNAITSSWTVAEWNQYLKTN
ncbi:MAG: hypothetical protein ACI8YQ_001796 [Polaribacter sp.]|jgi:hypothetical protein